MHIDTLIAEIRAGWERYDAMGHIDDASCYRWARLALKKFGQNIMELNETLGYVKNGKVLLPENFYELHYAVKCEPSYYCTTGSKSALVNSLFWKETVERSTVWNSCDSCCKEESEKTISERIYMEDCQVDFYYSNPTPLKLGRTIKKGGVSDDCRNKYVQSCPYEVIINERTMHTNFDEGSVFLQYYGLPMDDDGLPIIPDTPLGNVELYIEYYLKLRILEDILVNKDDANAIQLFNYYAGKEREQLGLATSDAKFSQLRPESFARLQNANRADVGKYELFFPFV